MSTDYRIIGLKNRQKIDQRLVLVLKIFVRPVLIFLLLTLVLISHESTAQNTLYKIPTKALQLYKAAQKDIHANNYLAAKTKLRESLVISPNYMDAHQTLADISRLSHQYDSAIIHYQYIIEHHPNPIQFNYFGLGESLLGLGKYEDAETALLKFLSLNKASTEQSISSNPSKDPVSLAKKYMLDIAFSKSYKKTNTNSEDDWDIQLLGPEINTSDDEYFPHFTADFSKLIFTRKTKDQENFYESDFSKENVEQTASLLKGQINSSDFNEGAHCISPDGKYIFFTGCNRPGGLGSCDLYVSKKENGLWSTPFNLGPPINTSGWEAQPSISADGQTLYFVSNRKGGFGGYDLWKSTLLSNGKWSDPVNLGPEINTPFDESAPFIHADNKTLYFTSNGWPGFGKKDFFRATRNADGTWTKPTNLGNLLNDHRDQSSIMIGMNGERGVFASQRNPKKQDLDLYYVKIPKKLRPQAVSYLVGIVVDAVSGDPLEAQVNIYDLPSQSIYYSASSDLEDGQFLTPLEHGKMYTLHIDKPGYLPYSEHYRLLDTPSTRDEYTLKVPLKKIETGKQEVLKNVFFVTNEATLLAESFHELNILVNFLSKNPQIRIEIGGHTDNTGNHKYNLDLSEKRAKSVWEYLLSKGVSKHRLSYKGYGADRPVATNETPEGRQQNRRTDFKIVADPKP